jgi:protein-S-isoprenylcysteine O-methyltransferase Ste14
MAGFVLLWGAVAGIARILDLWLGWFPPAWLRPLGELGIVAGAALGLGCAVLFSVQGEGTPVPFDPPRELVVAGPYRYIRNPMYVGGLAVLAGFGVVLRSPAILLLSAILLVAVHCFVVFVEEPGLEHRFGRRYLSYRHAVGRWLPSLSRWISSHHAQPSRPS